MLINKQVEYSINGLLAYRGNPDKTPASPSRILGFAGTVDLTSFGTSAELTVKIDSVAAEVKTVDYLAAIDQAAVTVAEMVTAITTAAFTGITATEDTTTGRLLIAASGTPDFLQVFDGVDIGFAAALDFGQGQLYGGPGVKIVKSLDNTISVSSPLNVIDSEEILTESGRGNLTTIIIPQRTKGVNPVLTFNDKDFNMKQLVMGGVYDEATNKYTPPNTDQTDSPVLTIEKYVDNYSKGTNKKGDISGVDRTIYYSCVGNEGDSSDEAKAIKNLIFNLICSEWNDVNGDKVAYKTEQILSIEDYGALDIDNL